MTPVHLYGVLEGEHEAASSTRGLDGQPVRTLTLAGRSAWVSDVPTLTLEATAGRLREHDAVLRGAVAAGYSVVPSLFGRLHASDAALTAALRASAESLDEAMALVRERVEMSFLIAPSGTARVSAAETPAATGGPGLAHLRRIKGELHAERILRDAALVLAQSATESLGGLVLAERVVENPAPPVLIARAHLVARDNVARYLRAAMSERAAADSGLRVAVRGPGAAYSFAAVQVG